MYELELELVNGEKGIKDVVSTAEHMLFYFWEDLTEADVMGLALANPKYGMKENVSFLGLPI
jgi:hypothetical protein